MSEPKNFLDLPVLQPDTRKPVVTDKQVPTIRTLGTRYRHEHTYFALFLSFKSTGATSKVSGILLKNVCIYFKKLSIVVFSPTIYFGPFWSWFLYIQIFTFFINYCMYCTSGIIHMFGSITFIYVCINKHLYVFLFSESKGRKRELSGGVYPSTMALLSLCMLYLRTPG